jgi:hypothetical protein
MCLGAAPTRLHLTFMAAVSPDSGGLQRAWDWRLGCKVLNLPGTDVSSYLDGQRRGLGGAHDRLKFIGCRCLEKGADRGGPITWPGQWPLWASVLTKPRHALEPTTRSHNSPWQNDQRPEPTLHLGR